MTKSLENKGKNGLALLIENQVYGAPRATWTPRGGLAGAVCLPPAPTPCIISAQGAQE